MLGSETLVTRYTQKQGSAVGHRLEVFGVRIPPPQADGKSGPERFEPFISFGSSEQHSETEGGPA